MERGKHVHHLFECCTVNEQTSKETRISFATRIPQCIALHVYTPRSVLFVYYVYKKEGKKDTGLLYGKPLFLTNLFISLLEYTWILKTFSHGNHLPSLQNTKLRLSDLVNFPTLTTARSNIVLKNVDSWTGSARLNWRVLLPLGEDTPEYRSSSVNISFF